MADALLKSQKRTAGYLANFLKNSKEKKSPATLTATYFEARIQLLGRYYDEFYDRHSTLLQYETEKKDDEYFKSNWFAQAEDAYIDALAELKADVERLRRPAVPAPAGGNNRATVTEHVKVPRVTLPTFSGKQSEWESFKQRFTSLISSKREYSDVDKLQYLLSSVEGKAAERLRGIEVTDENFKVAWDLLANRYDDVRKRLHNHLETLIQLPTVRSKNLADLEELMDKIIVAVRGLEKLGCNIKSYDNWLVHCISKKLDAHSRETWEISQEDKEGFYTYADLLSFLQRRINSLDSAHGQSDASTVGGHSARNSSAKPKRAEFTSVNTVGVADATAQSSKNSPTCHLCQGAHSIHSCDRFTGMSPSDRYNASKKAGLCLNCLRKGHSVSDCKSQNRCSVCKLKHHSKLHFESKAANQTPPSPSTGVASIASPAQVESESASAAHFVATKRSVLLATAIIIVCDRFGKAISARALVDPGAQRSFITERLATLLTGDSWRRRAGYLARACRSFDPTSIALRQ